jgi:hypothetical protein
MLSSRHLFSVLIEKREFLARMRLNVTGRRAYSDSTFISRQRQRLVKPIMEKCSVAPTLPIPTVVIGTSL